MHVIEAISYVQRIGLLVWGGYRWAPDGSAGSGDANAGDTTEAGLVVKVKIYVEVCFAGIGYLETKANPNVVSYKVVFWADVVEQVFLCRVIPNFVEVIISCLVKENVCEVVLHLLVDFWVAYYGYNWGGYFWRCKTRVQDTIEGIQF